MAKSLKVLFIEDSEADMELTVAELTHGGFLLESQRVETEEELLDALQEGWGLIICDYRMPRFSAEAALAALKHSGRDIPFIIMSGAVQAEDTVNLLKQGAHDFMDKHALARLIPAVERELREAEVRQERRRAEERVRILSRAVEQSPVSVVITDPEGQIEYVNPRFEELSGYSAGEATGRNLGFTLLDQDSASALTELWNTVSTGREWSGEFCSARRDGQLLWEQVSVSPLTDNDGHITHYVVIKEDITVRRSYEEQLLRQAHYDQLTGLANRVLMIDRLNVALEAAQRDGHQCALLVIDLDHFKNVNDSLGHSVGDNLLKESAGRLSGCIRGGDTLVRMGGDEFVVILPRVESAREAQQVAEQIVQQFERPFTIIGKQYRVTASIGIAFFPDDGKNPHLVLRNADLAMYKAKDLGRNQYHFFTEDINRQLIERLELEERLHRALDDNELVLFYQPIYSLEDNTVAGVEALVRWRQPDGSIWLPNRFIPLAEEIGVIQELDNWVLKTALRATAAWLARSQGGIRLALNISSQQLQMPGFNEYVAEQLTANGVSPTQLELEITERMLVDDSEATQHNIRALCDMGVRISIDDFGTGYSSLGYLQDYPFHTLKIDRSFVCNIGVNTNTSQLIETIITMGHGLGMDVVAEGVESDMERQFLRAHGCNQAQGYLFSHPLPLERLRPILNQFSPAAEGVSGAT
ncbi:putative bifunctional diguanylate cyclase/phosphodiesterase [Marinimicrobium sp. ARAG 43.8]|uniref:putative bifunctional diguanylate cyclase/phosphodiesterase n=1 Tax=Marinimicrobium sp. ARAG 43.8 TaxID=3418719 RepID=UPI003CED0D91